MSLLTLITALLTQLARKSTEIDQVFAGTTCKKLLTIQYNVFQLYLKVSGQKYFVHGVYW